MLYRSSGAPEPGTESRENVVDGARAALPKPLARRPLLRLAARTIPEASERAGSQPSARRTDPAAVDPAVADATLRVRLTDSSTGAPARHLAFGLLPAALTPVSESPLDAEQALRGLRMHWTDEAGEALLSGLAPQPVRVRIHSGLVSPAINVRAGEEELLEMQIATVELSGQVLASGGVPAVAAELWMAEASFDSQMPPVRIATAQEDGTFVATIGGSCGPRTIWAQSPTLGISPALSLARLRRLPRAVDGVELQLTDPVGQLRGCVTLPNGVPARDALVYVVESDATRPGRVFLGRTDASGRYRFDLLPSLPLTLVATSPNATGGCIGIERVELASGDLGTVNVRLDEGATVRGRVTRPDGRPLSDALVGACPDPQASSLGYAPALLWRHGRTNAEGEFAVPGLLAGPTTLCLVEHRTRGLLTRERLDLLAERTHTWSPLLAAPDRPLRTKSRFHRILSWYSGVEVADRATSPQAEFGPDEPRSSDRRVREPKSVARRE